MAGQDCDVLIVGAGMVGATLARALVREEARVPLRVAVVEEAALPVEGPPRQPGFDARSTALSQGSAGYLRELGLWPAMEAHATPIHRIHVSDQGRFGAVRLDHREHGVDALGYVAENAALGRVLNRALHDSAVTLRDATKVAALEPDASGVTVVLERAGGREELRTRLVVLAEGGRSGLAGRLGIARREESYGQAAVIANVCFEMEHSNTAFERFTPNGPLALLPLASFEGCPRAALVWTHGEEAVPEILALDDAAFLARLQESFGRRLGKFVRAGARASYPLSLVRALEQYRPGLVLLGNAANTLHPVAGQGFNLALRNSMMLAEAVLEAAGRGESPGAVNVLRDYAECVARDQELTVGFSDTLTRMFSSGNAAVALVRQFGLIGMEVMPFLKRALVEQAMGRSGRRARLHG